MITVPLIDIVARAVNSLLTIYMMLILLRWLAPWLQVDLNHRRLRWVTRLTDPLINLMRRALSSLERRTGPLMEFFDLGPIAALFVLWLVRTVCISFLAQPM